AEEGAIVMAGRVYPVPGGVRPALLVPLPLEEEPRSRLARALHPRRPFLPGIRGEGAHPLPGVQVPAASEAAPPAVLVACPLEPLERAADPRFIDIAEEDEGGCGVPGRAEVAPRLLTLH